MPTSRPRHLITETDSIARALDSAAMRWPDARENRAELVRRLILEAGLGLDRELEAKRQRVREAVQRIEAFDIHYPPNYLRQLREEWPE